MSDTIIEKLDKRIADLINIQVPEFIATDHPNFVTFMEAYYEWMESKFNRVIVNPDDGISIRFNVDLVQVQNQIILDNLSLQQSVDIYSFIEENSSITTSARYKENRGPLIIRKKELNQYRGNIKSVTDITDSTYLRIIAPEHDLGFSNDEVDIIISDTKNYNGRYTAIIEDDDTFLIQTNYVTDEFYGIWEKNYIVLLTDNLISNEIVLPNKKTILEYSLANIISCQVTSVSNGPFLVGEKVSQSPTTDATVLVSSISGSIATIVCLVNSGTFVTGQPISGVSSGAIGTLSSLISSSQTKVFSNNHNLKNNDAITIINSVSYDGEYLITRIDEDHFLIDTLYFLSDVGSSFILSKTKQDILSFFQYPNQVNLPRVSVLSKNHFLSIGDVIQIIETINYNGTFKVTNILSVDEFEIDASFITTEEGGKFLLPTEIGPKIVQDGSFIGTLFGSKKLLTYSDVDDTLDAFLQYFISEFLPNIPVTMLCDPKLLIKNVKDFYLSRGTEKSWKLLFRILYDEKVDFYYPSRDIFRADSGIWSQDKSILVVLVSDIYGRYFDPYIYFGKRIFGQSSKSSGIVKEIREHDDGFRTVYELFFEKNSITGEFLPNEKICLSLNSNENQSLILPILQDIIVTNLGSGYSWSNNAIDISSPYSFVEMSAIVNSFGPNGEVLGVNIINHSLGYPIWPITSGSDPIIEFQNTETYIVSESNDLILFEDDSGGLILEESFIRAEGIAKMGALIEYEGRYFTTDGFLDDIKKLRDDYYYQEFSYVAKTAGTSLATFRDVCKKLVHPSGLQMFAKIIIENHFDTIPAKEASIINHYKSSLNDFGRTVFAQSRYGDVVSSDTFQIIKKTFIENLLVGKKIISYKKLSQVSFPETSHHIVNSNQNNILTINSSSILFPSCDTIFIPYPDGNWYPAKGTRINDYTFQLDENLWPTLLYYDSLVGAQIYSYISLDEVESTVSQILSNDYDTIVVDIELEEDCNVIKFLDGGKEYYGVRISDFEFRVSEILWPDGFLIGKFLEINNEYYKIVNNFYVNGRTEIIVDGELPVTYNEINIYEVVEKERQNKKVELRILSYDKMKYKLFTDVIIQSLRKHYETHLVVGSNYRYLERNLKRSMPLPIDYPYYEYSSTVKGTCISPTVFQKSLLEPSVWSNDEYSIANREIISYDSTNPILYNISSVVSNTTNDITVDLLTPLYPAADRIKFKNKFQNYQNTIEEKTDIIYSGSVVTPDQFQIVSGSFIANQFINNVIYLFDSSFSDKRIGAYYVIESNTVDIINVYDIFSSSSYDSAIIDVQPDFVRYKDIINSNLYTGNKISSTQFDILGNYLVPDNLVGKRVFSYILDIELGLESGDLIELEDGSGSLQLENLFDENIFYRHSSVILSNTENSITVSGDLYPSCNIIEIVLSDINNYWDFANYQIYEFLNYKIEEFTNKYKDRTIICPEPRVYQYNI